MTKSQVIKKGPIVAAIQMNSSHCIEENLEMATQLIHEAANNGATLAVLPENFALMGLKSTDKIIQKETMGHGKIQDLLCKTSKINNIWLVGGTIPIASKNPNKITATCLVYDNHGNVVTHYNKIHLFDAIVSENEVHKESDTLDPGNNIVVIDTPVGKLGLAICFDVRFPEHFKQLFKLGAEIIALPAAFTKITGEAHWKILTKCRAIDTFSYLIGAAQGGMHSNGRETYGHSVIIDPWGNILAEKNDTNPGVIYSEINLDHLYKIRRAIPLR